MSKVEKLPSYEKFIGENKVEPFYKLPKKVIGDQLFSVQKELNTIYATVNKGDDFDLDKFKALISKLEKIAKSAKKFKSSRDLTKDFK